MVVSTNINSSGCIGHSVIYIPLKQREIKANPIDGSSLGLGYAVIQVELVEKSRLNSQYQNKVSQQEDYQLQVSDRSVLVLDKTDGHLGLLSHQSQFSVTGSSNLKIKNKANDLEDISISAVNPVIFSLSLVERPTLVAIVNSACHGKSVHQAVYDNKIDTGNNNDGGYLYLEDTLTERAKRSLGLFDHYIALQVWQIGNDPFYRSDDCQSNSWVVNTEKDLFASNDLDKILSKQKIGPERNDILPGRALEGSVSRASSNRSLNKLRCYDFYVKTRYHDKYLERLKNIYRSRVSARTTDNYYENCGYQWRHSPRYDNQYGHSMNSVVLAT